MITIQSSLMRYHFLQASNIDRFFSFISHGNGEELEKKDLDNFILLLPSENEIKLFKDKLLEFNLESFDELKNIKPPYSLKKLEKSEELMIKIISNEDIVTKARILHNLMG